MARNDSSTQPLIRRTCWVVLAVSFIAVLYIAREVFLPLCLAILLTFILAPVVTRMERWRMPRVVAVLGVSSGLTAVLLLLGGLLAQQTLGLIEDLPLYRANIVKKAESINGWFGQSMQNSLGVFSEIKLFGGKNAASNNEGVNDPTPAPQQNPDIVEPTPVIVVDQVRRPWDLAQTWLGPVLAPLGTVGIVTIFTIFMLLTREDLRNRCVVLMGHQRLFGTTQMLDEAAQKVGRYLLMQVLLNFITGLTIGLGLAILGLPNAILWGVLAMGLRFIPYLGPVLAMALPVALSLAVFEGWQRPLMVVGLFVIVELISNNVLEPLFYGASTGLSVLGILLSAFFWTWLWGTPGLILSTPIMVCVTVIGGHFPQFRFLNTLLSDTPALPPAAVVYQRLLANDNEEVSDTLEAYLADHSLVELCDEILLPAVRMAEVDAHNGQMDLEQSQFVQREFRNLTTELLDEQSASTPPEETDKRQAVRILCIPARDAGDEFAAELLGQLLRKSGHEVELLSSKSLVSEAAARFSGPDYDLAVISAMPPAASMHTRYLCKRLRSAQPAAKILVGYWTADTLVEQTRTRFTSRGADKVVNRLADALKWVQGEASGMVQQRVFAQAKPAPESELIETA